MKLNKIRLIDILIYITAILFDSFGIALLIKTGFGATPFGIFISSAELLVPLTTGMISLIYESVYILLACIIIKSRIKFELLIYSGIFAVMIDFALFMLPEMASFSLFLKVFITLAAIVFIDTAKALFNITIFPKLSIVEFMYALTTRFKWRIDFVQKCISLFNVTFGLLLSYIAGKPFYNLGLGTIIAMISFGSVLHLISPKIERWYENIKM